MKKSKPVVLKYENEVYNLEFNREAVKRAESLGFNYTDWTKYPATNVPILFELSFYKNYPTMSHQKIEEIIEKADGLPIEIIEQLFNSYTDCLNSLIDLDKKSKKENGQYFLEVSVPHVK